MVRVENVLKLFIENLLLVRLECVKLKRKLNMYFSLLCLVINIKCLYWYGFIFFFYGGEKIL